MFSTIRVKDKVQLTPNASSIEFEVESGSGLASFKAGQYITIRATINGEELRRSYSISSLPSEGLRIGVKKVEDGRMSGYLNDTVAVGDSLEVMGPDGNFILEDGKQQHVFFAAGSGITPVLSMMKQAISRNEKVALFFSNTSPNGVMYKDEVAQLSAMENCEVHWIYSQDGADVPVFSGRIDFGKATELIQRFTDPASSRAFYACGPAGMMEAVQTAMEVMGLGELRKEYFAYPDQETDATLTPATPQEAPAATFEGEARLLIHLDYEEIELTLNPDGNSVLNAVIDAGGDPPFSCKGGVCTTCRAKLLKGTVKMDANYALTDGEIADGHILTCQSHPTSPEVEISYDEV